MQNNFFTKTDNIFINKLSTINLTALVVFLIYFLSIILLPIANCQLHINTRQGNLFANRNNNINLSAQVLKLKTKTNNFASTVDTATYINNGQMLARQIDNNNLQSYVNDAKGSVLKLNSLDKLQNQIYSSDAYGKPITNITKANFTLNVINSFQYNGERFDNNTNLQYLRARFYNIDTKKFINQDTYDLLNKFGYVDGNPVINVDPEGHDSFNPFNANWWKNTWGSGANGIAETLGTTLGQFTATLGIVAAVRFLACKYRKSLANPKSIEKHLGGFARELLVNEPGITQMSNKQIERELTSINSKKDESSVQLPSKKHLATLANGTENEAYNFLQKASQHSGCVEALTDATIEAIKSNPNLLFLLSHSPVTIATYGIIGLFGKIEEINEMGIIVTPSNRGSPIINLLDGSFARIIYTNIVRADPYQIIAEIPVLVTLSQNASYAQAFFNPASSCGKATK